MNQKPIDLTDWHRFLAGSTPWQFLIEVFLRALLTYVILMFAVRLLGKRMGAHLSLFELSMIVTLAAATGIPLEVPDRGMLPPIVVLVAVIVFQRVVSLWGLKKRQIEQLVTGSVTLLLQDGRMHLDQLGGAVLSRERVFAALRTKGIQHLGQIRRLYLEASGDFSVMRAHNPLPGLSLIPEGDPDLRAHALAPGFYVCARCGDLKEGERPPATRCGYCDSGDWVEAVTELDDE